MRGSVRNGTALRALAALNDQLAAENAKLLQEAAAFQVAATETSAAECSNFLCLGGLQVPHRGSQVVGQLDSESSGDAQVGSSKRAAGAAILRQNAAARGPSIEQQAQEPYSKGKGGKFDSAAPSSDSRGDLPNSVLTSSQTKGGVSGTLMAGNNTEGGLLDASTWALQAVAACAMLQRHKNICFKSLDVTLILDGPPTTAAQQKACQDVRASERMNVGTAHTLQGSCNTEFEVAMLSCKLDAAEARLMEVRLGGAAH
jgi:hypothetical protein